LTGLSFNGYDKASQPQWNGLSNVLAWEFETATSLNAYVSTFNINTNHWAKRYVFKRLIFLGSRNLSSLGTLMFLAVWHGYHPGYFITFAMEFMDMEAERRGARLFAPVDKALSASAVGQAGLKALYWLLTTSSFHYALIAFDLLDVPSIMHAWSNVYFIGLWSVLAIVTVEMFVTARMQATRRHHKQDAAHEPAGVASTHKKE
jgi:lysophospholipid acyltransferase 5